MKKTLIMLLALSLSGCVTMKKYKELEADLASTSGILDERDQENADLNLRVAKLKTRVADLEDAIRKAKDELKARQEALTSAHDEKARMLADQSQLESDVEAMRMALDDLQIRRDQAEARLRDYQDLLARFQSLIDAGKLKVKIVDGRMVVELATDVLFSSGSANLSKDGKVALTEVASVLASIPNRSFQVAGHTDNDPIHTSQYPSNWQLAAARALTVVDTLVVAGMPAERISASSYAEFNPVASNDTKEGKAANRRIEIVVVPDLSELPGYEELESVGKGKRAGNRP